jgi:2-hydroxy-6-oxonona-2,4-dienedioate hydrolase
MGRGEPIGWTQLERRSRRFMRSDWRRVDGLDIHARVAFGAPHWRWPPVVLVHGLVISSLLMVPIAERLSGDFPVFAPDLPGFGLSDKPDEVMTLPRLADALAAWMDAAGLERAVFLGNSLGCQILAELGVRHPQRACGLILQGPTADRRTRNAPGQILRLLLNSVSEPSIGLSPVLDYARAGFRRARKTFRYLLEDAPEAKLPLIRAPTLIVRGALDPVVPQEWAEYLVGLLPRGRLVVVPGAAHTMVTLAPLELARVARPFIGQCGDGCLQDGHSL